jgi:hypothetical protein
MINITTNQKMKKILAINPIDTPDEDISQSAICIAKSLKAETFLWMKVDAGFVQNKKKEVVHAGDVDTVIDEVPLDEFDGVRERGQADKPKVEGSVSHLLEIKYSNDLLSDIVRKEQIELVVISSGAKNSVPDVPESEVYDILEKAKCPVLIIPKNHVIKNIDNIAYVTDLRYCDMSVIRPLVKLAGAFRSGIQLVHLTADGLPEMAECYMRDYFKHELSRLMNYPKVRYVNLKHKNKAEELNQKMSEIKADIMVLQWKRHGMFNKLFKASSSVYDFSRIPLILFP